MRGAREFRERHPDLAARHRQLAELLAGLGESASQFVPDEIDAGYEPSATPGLNVPNVSCRLLRKQLLVIQSGLGQETTRIAGQLIGGVDRVWLIGFAGALDPSLKVGDVVEPRAVLSVDFLGTPIELSPVGVHLLSPRLVTSREIVSMPAEKAALGEASQCAAVDMEAFDLACVCQAHGRSFHTARVISDAADEPFPKELDGIILPSGNLSMRRLVWAVLKKPTLLGALDRLRWNSRKAKEGLRMIVRRLVESLA